MLCNDVTQWLDDGMPPAGAAAARSHAAGCASCARALAAAASIERALALPPPAPHRGAERFTASVLASIRGEGAAEHAAEPERERMASRPAIRRLLGSLLAEPAFAIGSIALATFLLVSALPRGDAGRSLAVTATVAAQSLDAVTQQILTSALAYPASVATLDPVARATLIVCFLALLVGAGLWMADAVDRSLRRGGGRRV